MPAPGKGRTTAALPGTPCAVEQGPPAAPTRSSARASPSPWRCRHRGRPDDLHRADGDPLEGGFRPTTPLSAQAWPLRQGSLGLAALLLVGGSLADDFGRRRIFVSGTFASGWRQLWVRSHRRPHCSPSRIAQGAAGAALLRQPGTDRPRLLHPQGRIRATGVWEHS